MHAAVDPRSAIGQVPLRSCASRALPATAPRGGPRTHVPEAVRSPWAAAADFRVTDSVQAGLTPEPGSGSQPERAHLVSLPPRLAVRSPLPSRPGTECGTKGRKDTGGRPEPRRPPARLPRPSPLGQPGAGSVAHLASIRLDLPARHGRGDGTRRRCPGAASQNRGKNPRCKREREW